MKFHLDPGGCSLGVIRYGHVWRVVVRDLGEFNANEVFGFQYRDKGDYGSWVGEVGSEGKGI